MSRSARLALLGAVAGAVSVGVVTEASAHPHVWVSVETTVIYAEGTITGLRQRWLFDEIYSSMAIQGLDANGDGSYDQSELAELAKVNIDGLKQFDYFTFAKLGDQPLSFDSPTDFILEHAETTAPPQPGFGANASAEAAAKSKDGGSFWAWLTRSLVGSDAPEKSKVLALEFTLPLSKPVLAEAEGFTFSTHDPSFFIWFDLVGENPIRLADSAPSGCKADIIAPMHQSEQVQQLSDAAFDQNSGINISFGYAKTVKVSCS